MSLKAWFSAAVLGVILYGTLALFLSTCSNGLFK